MKKKILFLALCCTLVASSTLREDPTLEWSFSFNCVIPGFGGDSIASFWTEISGIQNRNEWECESVNGRETTSCLPSQLVTSPISLSRTLSYDDSMWRWRDLITNGHLTEARANCTIRMFSRNYTESFAFMFYNAWPASWSIEPVGTMESGMNPRYNNERNPSDAALVEKVIILHEALGRSGHPVPILIRVGTSGKKRDASGYYNEADLQAAIAAILGIEPQRISIISQSEAADGFYEVVFEVLNIPYGTGSYFDHEGLVVGSDVNANVLAVAFIDSFIDGAYDSTDIFGEDLEMCVSILTTGYASSDTCKSPVPCVGPDGRVFNYGESGVYYKSRTVNCNSKKKTATSAKKTSRFFAECEQEERFCYDGVLDGSFTASSCFDCSCDVDSDTTLADGQVAEFYTSTDSCSGPCTLESRTCTRGVLSGDPAAVYDSCSNICP